MILKDAFFSLGGTDLSGSLRGLTMNEGSEQQSAEAHGDDWRWFEEGMRNGGCAVQLWQDFSSGGVDDTISALQGAGGAVAIVRPDSAVAGGDNPSFTFTVNIENYERFSGDIGQRAICSLDLVLAAATGIVRAES